MIIFLALCDIVHCKETDNLQFLGITHISEKDFHMLSAFDIGIDINVVITFCIE